MRCTQRRRRPPSQLAVQPPPMLALRGSRHRRQMSRPRGERWAPLTTRTRRSTRSRWSKAMCVRSARCRESHESTRPTAPTQQPGVSGHNDLGMSFDPSARVGVARYAACTRRSHRNRDRRTVQPAHSPSCCPARGRQHDQRLAAVSDPHVGELVVQNPRLNLHRYTASGGAFARRPGRARSLRSRRSTRPHTPATPAGRGRRRRSQGRPS